MQHLKDLSVLILGLGSSGLAMARWCARHGARVTVADTRENPPQRATLAAEWPEASFVAGALTADLVEGAAGIRAVYRSPGLAPAAVAPVLNAARALGLPVGGELDLFTRAMADLAEENVVDAVEPSAISTGYRPAVLAVTGTNGKTTVTALTGLLVERAGRTVAVAGNIGPTLLDTLSAHIDAATLPDVWVLELSSFQLADVCGFEPTAATVLNLSQDHLDWHGDMAAYTAAKANVFGATGLMVLNRDDAAVMALIPPPVKQRLQKPQQRAYVTFGAEVPRRPGDFGIETVNGMTWLVRAAEADETHGGMRSRRSDAGGAGELHIQRLMPADALRIRGRHNAVNALAALALAQAAGCTLAPMLFGLREYRGEPHRVEAIALHDGVEFFDDSKGTNVGATVAALQGLGDDRKLVVILGGDGKGQDFSPLALPVERHARAVVLIGRDAPLLREALVRTGTPLHDAGDMQAAVRMAARLAQQGDAVLLSPACASFDMFTGYEHRAQVYCAEVMSLVEDGSSEALIDDDTDQRRIASTSAALSRSGEED
jgi:UDP-N-acetylmuramoylalanine--D-glutamate ligase